MAEKQTIHLIGLSPNLEDLAPTSQKIIAEAEVLAATKRFLNIFSDSQAEMLPLDCPLAQWFEKLKTHHESGKKIVILASGDPNYYGLGKRLMLHFESSQVVIIPSLTTVQIAFARLKTPWEKIETASLHGRQSKIDFWASLYRAAHLGSGFLAVYTDEANSPEQIAKRLLARGQTNWRMHVFEDLRTPHERISCLSLFEASNQKFSPLNLVVLECEQRPLPIGLGLPESSYSHEAGLITKKEVRVVTLSLLNLAPHHTVWDLGAGSGSISIEAAPFVSHGSIWAVEKSPIRAEQIAINRTKFGVAQVEIVEDDSTHAISHLPPPHRIFIGGGGRDLDNIIRAARLRLNPGGLMVINLVTIDRVGPIISLLNSLNLETSITQLQVSRSAPLGEGLYLKPLNQVWLISAFDKTSLEVEPCLDKGIIHVK
ncbi:MAG: precorrin-6y C5,15-methyltransferase (decarboxylating) subunit CbiE [Candidatus Adiutrix sp.]